MILSFRPLRQELSGDPELPSVTQELSGDPDFPSVTAGTKRYLPNQNPTS